MKERSSSDIPFLSFSAIYTSTIGLHVRRVSAKKSGRKGKWREIEQCESTPHHDHPVSSPSSYQYFLLRKMAPIHVLSFPAYLYI